MIVKANSNSDLYKELFTKAEELLNENGGSITIKNISDYFTRFNDILAACGDDQDKIAYFTILPMMPEGEEFFEIDANTRTISVPQHYQKNGVSVQGDQLAEVIYFSIDRYFDTVDFNEVRNKIIQVKIPSTNKNGEDTDFRFRAYNLTTRYPGKEDKLVFGWPISKELTKYSGNLEFSVRFYEIDESKDDTPIIYSFNTLPQRIKINASLNFDDLENDEDNVDRTAFIRQMIKNSSNKAIPQIAIPTLERLSVPEDDNGISTGIPIRNTSTDGSCIVKIGNFLIAKPSYNGPNSKSSIVAGNSFNNSEFSTRWEYIPTNDKSIPFVNTDEYKEEFLDNNKVTEAGKYIFEVIDSNTKKTFATGDEVYYPADDNFDEHDRYYNQNKVLQSNITKDNFNSFKNDLYEQFFKFNIIGPGSYGVQAINTSNVDGVVLTAKSGQEDYIVPGPADFSIGITANTVIEVPDNGKVVSAIFDITGDDFIKLKEIASSGADLQKYVSKEKGEFTYTITTSNGSIVPDGINAILENEGNYNFIATHTLNGASISESAKFEIKHLPSEFPDGEIDLWYHSDDNNPYFYFYVNKILSVNDYCDHIECEFQEINGTQVSTLTKQTIEVTDTLKEQNATIKISQPAGGFNTKVKYKVKIIKIYKQKSSTPNFTEEASVNTTET